MSAMTLPLSTLRLATIAFAIGLALGSAPVSAQEMDHSKMQMPPAATPPPVRKPAVKKPATRKPAAKPATAAKKQVADPPARSEEHTSAPQSLMRISYAVFCLQKKT